MLSLAATRDTDIRVEEVTYGFEDYLYRTPIKFGGTEVDRVTLLNVNATVRTRGGKTAKGFGSMPLGNVWSFPSKTMPYAKTLGAMKELSKRIAASTNAYNREFGHPIDINIALEPEYLKAADAISKEQGLDAPVPKLCTLVTASPFDAAIHDAFGKLHNRSSYQTYGSDLMRYDLSHYIGNEFKGEYLDRYVMKAPETNYAVVSPGRRGRQHLRERCCEAGQ